MAARLRAALRKASALSARDWWRFALGQVALVRAWIDVRTRPQGELVHSGSVVAATTPPGASPNRLADVRRVALGVSRASVYGAFNPTCLVRSLAICRCLEQEGISGGVVRVGVARRHGTFVAHAWVEYAGEIIGDDEGTADRYASLNDLRVSTRP